MQQHTSQYFDPKTRQWRDRTPDDVIADGAIVRVGMMFMDAAQRETAEHSRTALQDAWDLRDAAYDQMCYDLDPLTPVKSDQFNGTRQPLNDAEAANRAYDQYVTDLCNAYRNGGEPQ